MSAPLVCFISYNRLGVAASNLEALLRTEDDFELVIVDNGSTDGIWEYILGLKDERIKLKQHFDKNYGGVYAINFGMSKRSKNQAFIHMDNDIRINEKHWVKKLEQTVNAFPELGLIGVISEEYLNQLLSQFPQNEESILKNLSDKAANKFNMIFTPETREQITCYYNPMIIGCFNYLSPQVIDLIGYWNEETYGADTELGRRINMFTPYFTAITTAFYVDIIDVISCQDCPAKAFCKFNKERNCECFWSYYNPNVHPNQTFAKDLPQKVNQYFMDILQNKRPVYSASIHDKESIQNHYYDKEAAMKNFEFFANFNKSNS